MTTRLELPVPPIYDAAKAYDSSFRITNPREIMDQATDWARQYGIRNSARDGDENRRVRLLGIDPQWDFGFQEGSLFVGGSSGKGAMEDMDRATQFVYRNLGLVTSMTLTLDTHHPFQVFYPSAHVMADGSHPATWSPITVEDYKSGKIRANPAMAAQLGVTPAWLTQQFQYYCEQLAASGRYELTLWPEHCMLGSHGHQIAGVLDQARYFHSYARGVTNELAVKGGNQLTENYSIFKPEVNTFFNGNPIPGAQKNAKLIELFVEQSDMVVIFGEAMSHCLAWSVQDLITEIFSVYNPELAKKLYILEDCTSPVVVPGLVDHTPAALKAFDEFRNRGVNIVRSQDPVESWPGIAQQIAARAA